MRYLLLSSCCRLASFGFVMAEKWTKLSAAASAMYVGADCSQVWCFDARLMPAKTAAQEKGAGLIPEAFLDTQIYMLQQHHSARHLPKTALKQAIAPKPQTSIMC